MGARDGAAVPRSAAGRGGRRRGSDRVPRERGRGTRTRAATVRSRAHAPREGRGRTPGEAEEGRSIISRPSAGHVRGTRCLPVVEARKEGSRTDRGEATLPVPADGNRAPGGRLGRER